MRFIDRLAEYSDQSILRELRRVADELGKDTLTMADLSHAKLCYATLKNRFGGLREALRSVLVQPEMECGRFFVATRFRRFAAGVFKA